MESCRHNAGRGVTSIPTLATIALLIPVTTLIICAFELAVEIRNPSSKGRSTALIAMGLALVTVTAIAYESVMVYREYLEYRAAATQLCCQGECAVVVPAVPARCQRFVGPAAARAEKLIIVEESELLEEENIEPPNYLD
jgi:hypothetical protein